MWICLNNAFFSIVTPSPSGSKTSSHLLVRARRKGDIESVFPNADIQVLEHRDYLFRALVLREDVAKAMSKQVMDISYGNFKNSVKDRILHHAYAQFWSIHNRLQHPFMPSSRDRKM